MSEHCNMLMSRKDWTAKYITMRPPLIRPSKLSDSKGGNGKALSSGWVANFAIGCTHGCPFCYVDSIVRRVYSRRYRAVKKRKWGDYLLLPRNVEELILLTPWNKLKGEEVLMSSMHDPYLPQLVEITHRILDVGLREGVRFCIQTRSSLVIRSLKLLEEHRNQVRLQVSIATLEEDLFRLIEPRVPPPTRRLKILQRAKDRGIKTGVVIAPVLPPVPQRRNVEKDLKEIFEALASIGVDQVFGEALHPRGRNLKLLEEVIGARISVSDLIKLDKRIGRLFEQLLKEFGLAGRWWYEPWSHKGKTFNKLGKKTKGRPAFSQ